jgi:hypothetical protein
MFHSAYAGIAQAFRWWGQPKDPKKLAAVYREMTRAEAPVAEDPFCVQLRVRVRRESARPSLQTSAGEARSRELEPSRTTQALIAPGLSTSKKGSPLKEPYVTASTASRLHAAQSSAVAIFRFFGGRDQI